jgi:hypothetical protein
MRDIVVWSQIAVGNQKQSEQNLDSPTFQDRKRVTRTVKEEKTHHRRRESGERNSESAVQRATAAACE